MAENSRRRNTIIVVIVILLILALLLLLTRCLPEKTPAPSPAPQDAPTTPPGPVASTGGPAPTTTEPAEVLTPATLTVPQNVTAGAAFAVTWTGPDNRGDFVTIVPPDAPATEYTNYQETKDGKTLELTAPIEPGTYEVRYVAVRSHTVLGRAPIAVDPAGATVDAPNEITLGATFDVAWTGPNNQGDFITIVPKDAPDEQYAAYVYTDKGSPVTLTAPTITGDHEVRYVTGQAKKVLARRAIEIMSADVTLAGPDQAIAGTTIAVTWTGPDNAGDYITVVSSDTRDGQYGNYTYTNKGSPLELVIPIMAGSAELRYMTGQGNRVLGRRAITIVAAEVTLSAPAEGSAGSAVSITWTGPNNPKDYITIVPTTTPDGQYAAYTYTSDGSPLSVTLPKDAGDAEIRYMTGQGNEVLARLAIKVVP